MKVAAWAAFRSLHQAVAAELAAAAVAGEGDAPDGIKTQSLPHLRHNQADDGLVEGTVGEEGGHGISLLGVVKTNTASSAFRWQTSGLSGAVTAYHNRFPARFFLLVLLIHEILL